MKEIPQDQLETQLGEYIRDIPDFPKAGILFKDITPLLQNPKALRLMTEQLALRFRDAQIDYIAGIESRGFIFGMPLAYEMGVGFIPIRKAGKLPAETFQQEYALEYGTDTIEIHRDALRPGQRVLLIDDLLATGGTAAAALSLLEKAGADVVAAVFAIELTFLKGIERLGDCKTLSLIKY